jgi:CheY-like chemotaxis protein
MECLRRDLLRIVHVEDDDDFARLTGDNLKQAGFTRPVVRCADGLIALDYFGRVEPESAPHVILLNLLMPRMRGLSVLNWLRNRASDRDLAVYLLSSSDHPLDLRQTAATQESECFVVPPIFEKLVQSLDHMMMRRNDLCHKGVLALVPDRSSVPNKQMQYETVQTKRLTISFAASMQKR